MYINIKNLPKSKAGNIYATDINGARFTFASKELASTAKINNYAFVTSITSDSTYKRDANGVVELVNDAPVLIKREGGPVTFNQITTVFATQADYFRAKNENKLEAVAERVFLKKELKALGDTEGLEEDEIAKILAMA